MKKPLKILRNIIIAILILVIVLLVIVHLYANRAIKWGIETAGSKTLGVGVTVQSAKLGITSGSLGLKGLIIDNPKEYQNPHMLELASGKVKVAVGSLLSNTIKIKQIKLDDVNVVLEQKDIRGNNIQDILKNIPSSPQDTKTAGRKLQIETLEITNIHVKVKLLPVPGKADTITLPLSTITMTNLGSDNKLNTAQLVSKILVAITEGIAKEGAGVLPGEIIGALNTSLKQLGDLSQSLLKGGEDILKGTPNIQEKTKDLTKGLEGLLKQKKEQK
jgi:hypothetical protein